MDGAIYALIVNVCVAGLFAIAFAVIRLSYPGQRQVTWFCIAYLIGMGTPLSELAVRFTAWPTPFMITSYGCFLLCVAIMPVGLSALARRAKPWAAAGTIVVLGVIDRVLIWGGPRNDLAYELSYQAPFAAATILSMLVAIGAARRNGGRLWLSLAIVFGLMTAHFVAKPFFATLFGSGRSARDYAGSAYAMFSQATGGVLIVMAGLLILLLVVQQAMGQSIAESETDPLTGLDNRRGFERKGVRLIAHAAATGSPLTAIVFDLDHFKRINDGYGHATGDAVIRAFADILRATLPPTAVAARMGGEEFAVLLDRTTLRGAWLAAQAVRGALPGLGAHLPAVTVSGGLAELAPSDTLATIVERADHWTYTAKNEGRNRIAPMPDPVLSGMPRLVHRS